MALSTVPASEGLALAASTGSVDDLSEAFIEQGEHSGDAEADAGLQQHAQRATSQF